MNRGDEEVTGSMAIFGAFFDSPIKANNLFAPDGSRGRRGDAEVACYTHKSREASHEARLTLETATYFPGSLATVPSPCPRRLRGS